MPLFSIFTSIVTTAVIFTILCLLTSRGVTGTNCPQPSTSHDVYILSPSHSSYSPGFVFEAVCIPGHTPSSVVQLYCDSSGSWIGSLPDCEKDVTGARWWILLILVVTVIILIPCTVPRLYFYYLEKPQLKLSRRQQMRNSIQELMPAI